MTTGIKNKFIEDYWVDKLNKMEFIDLSREGISSTESIVISEDEIKYLNKLTGKNPIADFTIVLTLYAALLERYFSGYGGIVSSEFNFGTNDGEKPLIFSVSLAKSNTFKNYLQEVKKEVQEVFGYKDYNAAGLKKRLNGVSPKNFTLFELSFNARGDKNLDRVFKDSDTAFHLNLLRPEQGGMEIRIDYEQSFAKNYIANHFLENIKNWIVNLEDYLSLPINQLSILSSQERHQILEVFNDTAAAYPEHKTMVDLFEEQVAKTPDNVALVFEDYELTYKEVNEHSNQWANYLRTVYNVEPNDLIGVKLVRNEQLIIAMLGILKSGGAYVPMDINYPEERIAYIERDSKSKLVIDAEELRRFTEVRSTYSKENVTRVNQDSDLAYVIYTSGTTGNPKGVMIEHRNAVALINWSRTEFDTSAFDVVYAVTSHCFDLSVYEMFYTLSTGKKLRVLANALSIKNHIAFDDNILLNTVPSVIGRLIEQGVSLDHVSHINMAGEVIPVELLKGLPLDRIVVRNLYGPSEDTTYSTCYVISDKPYRSIPIGKPIANTQVYILDDEFQPVPVGVSGRIYVSGSGVTRGYLNRKELTQKRFVKNPFIEGERMYDTGDIGSWLPDGNIEFIGRKDYQVKLRGYRIELGEVEHKISSYSKGIKGVVVEVKKVKGEQVLVAYYSLSEPIDKSVLRGFLQEKLPDYMVPTYFLELDALPLSPNGKINRKALPDVSGTDIIRREYVAPRNETEKQLVEIWQEVLGLGKIGITDNFFELGGHSLMVAQVINRTHKLLGRSVSFKEFFNSATIEELGSKLQENQYVAIPRAPEASSYPLTASQHRLWVLSQLEGSSLAYNMPAAVKISGAIDVALFEESFRRLIARHEILRTYFKAETEDEEIRQHIMPYEAVTFSIEQKDYSSEQDQQLAVDNYLEEKNSIPFNLEQAPLMRASLLKLRKEEYIFFLSQHHIIGDGWSIELLISEVVKIYNSLVKGEEVELPVLNIQYKDYTLWLQEELKGEKHQASEEYWLKQFEGELPVLNLPSFKPRPVIQTYNGNTVKYNFSREFLNKLKKFSEEQDVTLFMTLMAGVNVLLHKCTSQEDIIIGTPVAGREHPDLEYQMGLYLNTLAIRTSVEKGERFLDLLKQQKETLLEAFEYQNYPFDELVGKLNLKRDMSRSALFDVMVILQSQERLNNLTTKDEVAGLEVEDYRFERKTSQFDISFTFTEREGLGLSIEYNTDIYDSYLIECMFCHIEELFIVVLKDPECLIEDIDYLGDVERNRLLSEFNNTEVEYPKNKTIIDLFEEQVAKTPENIAVVFEQTALTYKELHEQSNQFASYLKENYNVQPNDLIGIKLVRDEQLIVVVLGILKSGAAYVPIDINYPQERIAYIEKDSNSKLVIDSGELERFTQVRETCSKEHIEKNNNPDDLAYLIYTSGTTGNPKGVMLSHSNAVALIHWSKSEFNPSLFDVVYGVTSHCFDLSVYEMFYTLSVGKTLRVLTNALSIKDHIESDSKILLNTVPSVIRKLTDERVSLHNVSCINMAGEVIPVELLKKLPLEKMEVRNLYGPSEDTTYSTGYLIADRDYTSIPIGKPISNTQAYILDEKLHPVSIGVTGNLYVSGTGLAKGYFNREDLTQEKFITHPFIEGARMYATGDLGRWLPDGNIEFLGREDHQVKVRGYRIELGEIEHTISQYSKGLKQVVVVAKEVNQEKVLAAYYAASEAINKSELRTFMQEKLPDYMVPTYFLEMESIPLTPNGKIDRKALPGLSGEDIIRKEYVAPRNSVEKNLVKIWQEVLGLERIGITDNFFELGGHSLKISRLLNLINKKFNVKLTFSDLFLNVKIEDQAEVISKSDTSAHRLIPKAPEQEGYALSSSQLRLWILSQFEGGNIAYNMPSVFILEGNLDIESLENAFQSLIERHESLRTVFKENEAGEIQQIILPRKGSKFRLQYEDLSKEKPSKENIEAHIQEELHYTFNLAEDSLLRARLLKTARHNYVFSVVMHHIISDGWSVEVMMNELFTLYDAFVKGNPNPLPPLRIQYKDYALWQQEQLHSENVEEHKSYWLKQFEGEIPVLDLPSFKSRPTVQTYAGKQYKKLYEKELTEKFSDLCQSHTSTLFMGLLAAVKVLLYRYTHQKDIIIGSPIAGRAHADLQHQIGFYVNTLALRTQFEGEDSFETLLSKIKEVTLEAYEHQSYPFDELVENLPIKRDMSRNPLFDVMVTFQNTDNLNVNIQELDGLNIKEYEGGQDINSKFDLEFIFEETNKGLALALTYNTDIYSDAFIAQLTTHLDILLQSIIANPEASIHSLTYLSEAETQQLLEEFNATSVKYPKDNTIVDLFEAQVAETPENIAVVFEQTELTYKALNERSNQFASYLRENYDIQPNDLIGVKLGRDEQLIITILGILKSGAAYVPIDINYPEERIAYIEEDSKSKLVIDSEALERFTQSGTKYAKENVAKNNTSNDLAYIIYTSGTTGNPKGVMITHSNAAALIHWSKSAFDSSQFDIVYGVTSHCFDLSVYEMFYTLSTGKTLRVLANALSIKDHIESDSKILLNTVPSVVRGLVEEAIDLKHVSCINMAGEVIPVALLGGLPLDRIAVRNLYGPSEDTTYSTNYRVTNQKYTSVPIGKPISNTRVYILDEALQIVPIGVTGSIYVSGSGLAKGYLNREDLTQEKFIAHPFAAGERMYATGDLGRWLPDGNIEFLGREDHQVKVRGYRIELGEIEHAILSYSESLKQVVVEAKMFEQEKVLAAYYAASETIDKSELKGFLQKKLPEYMVPSHFLELESIPLTPNGKIDRKALPGLSGEDIIRKEYVAPRNEFEEKLVEIWQEVLNISKIGVKDNFFELGGHSLSATRLASFIYKEFEIKVFINDLFNNVILEDQAALIENIKLMSETMDKDAIDESEVESFSL